MKYGMTMGSLGAHGKAGLLKSTEDYFRKARELGYDSLAVGVENVPAWDDQAKLGEFKRFLDDQGMLIEMWGNPMDEVSYEVSNFFGAPSLQMALNFRARFTQKWNLPRQREELAKDVGHLGQIEKLARKHDLPVAVENHMDYTTDEFLEILAAVNSPSVGVLLDTANQIAMTEDPVQCCRRLAPHVLATHWKEALLIEAPDGPGVIWGVPGEGVAGLAEQARILGEQDKDIFITLEFLDHFVVPIPYKTAEYWACLGRSAEQNADGVCLLDEASKLQTDPRPTSLDALVSYEADTRARSLSAMKAMFGDTRDVPA